MNPELELVKLRIQRLHEEASRDRLVRQLKKQRPRHRSSGLLFKLLRNPEASAASAARRQSPA